MATLEISFTPLQCRAGRALLGWKQEDLRRVSNVSQKTIADFELGLRQPFPHTLHALKEALAESGVEFLDAVEGVRGPGVALKWEKEMEIRAAGQGNADQPAGEGGTKAADPELLDYWRDRPEQWARLSEGGRQVQAEAIFGDAFAADEFLPTP